MATSQKKPKRLAKKPKINAKTRAIVKNMGKNIQLKIKTSTESIKIPTIRAIKKFTFISLKSQRFDFDKNFIQTSFSQKQK